MRKLSWIPDSANQGCPQTCRRRFEIDFFGWLLHTQASPTKSYAGLSNFWLVVGCYQNLRRSPTLGVPVVHPRRSPTFGVPIGFYVGPQRKEPHHTSAAALNTRSPCQTTYRSLNERSPYTITRRSPSFGAPVVVDCWLSSLGVPVESYVGVLPHPSFGVPVAPYVGVKLRPSEKSVRRPSVCPPIRYSVCPTVSPSVNRQSVHPSAVCPSSVARLARNFDNYSALVSKT